MQANKPLPEDLTLDNILTNFATDANARNFLESLLWPQGAVCPRCKTNDQKRIAKVKANKDKGAREGLYRCNDCRRTFTVTVGTIFHDSHIPLRKWIIGLFLMASSKKGMSSLQFMRILGLGSYRSALYMTDRIRVAMTEGNFAEKIKGTVEVDECYFGPKPKFRGVGSMAQKVGVVALVERETGKRRSVVMKRVTAKNLQQAVRDNVVAGATINTDEHPGYKGLKADYRHKTVRHTKFRGKKEYHRIEANGEVVTTNYAESSFSLLRRGVIGTFHNLSTKYLPLYVSEFDFRFNARKVTDGERMIAAIKKTAGKRITLKQLKA
jgi:transposase-like protein